MQCTYRKTKQTNVIFLMFFFHSNYKQLGRLFYEMGLTPLKIALLCNYVCLFIFSEEHYVLQCSINI